MKQISTVILLVALFSCAERANNQRPEKAIISKHVIRWTEPGKRIPSNYSVFAPVLGNGYSGVAIAGEPDNQVFYLARNDFWRLKSGHNESYPLVLGKIELSVPQFKDASFVIEQSLYDAVTSARFSKNNETLTYNAFVAATKDLFVVEIGYEGKGEVEGLVKLSLPGAEEIVENLPLERAFPGKMELKTTDDGIQYLSRAFEDSVDIPTKAAIALKISGKETANGKFKLKAGEKLRLIASLSSNFKSEDCVAEVLAKAVEYSNDELLSVAKTSHKAWWEDYWSKSYVSIPDSVVEKQYYVSLYGTACTSRDPDFPPGLFGVWITREQPAWMGDYHTNYNFQAAFYALYSANRIEQADPCNQPYLAFMPRGEYYSEKVTGIKNGLYYPVGIGPLGIETTLWTPYMENNITGWWSTINVHENIEDNGMFWGQKSDAAYCAVNVMMQFYYTLDMNYTRRMYPFVKGVATFWENYVKWENNRYVIYNDAIHEGTVGDMNGVLSLGFVKMIMQLANDMSEMLQTDADRREKWLHVRDNISDYPLMERNGKTVFRYTEKGIGWVDGNTLGIQHIYPAGVIGLDSDPELLQIAYNTVDEMRRWLDTNASNSMFPAAVRVGYSPDTILYQLGVYSKHTAPNGFQLDNPHGVENWSTVPNTINEMLCMSHHGIIRPFAGWVRSKDAMFHNIRAEGAFLVSGAIRNGEVCDLSVYSEKGSELRLLNPWKGRKVSVQTTDKEDIIIEGDLLRFETRAGATYRFNCR